MSLDKRHKAKKRESMSFIRVYLAWQNIVNLRTMATPTKKKCYYCGFTHMKTDHAPPIIRYAIIVQYKDILLKYAVHEKTKNKEKTERKDLVHQIRRHGTKKQQAKAVEASQRQTKDESSEEDYVYTVSKEQNKKTHVDVRVNGQNVHFLIDTGATADIIDSNTFEKLNKKVSLQKSSTKIYAYGFQTPLPLKGKFQGTLESKKR